MSTWKKWKKFNSISKSILKLPQVFFFFCSASSTSMWPSVWEEWWLFPHGRPRSQTERQVVIRGFMGSHSPGAFGTILAQSGWRRARGGSYRRNWVTNTCMGQNSCGRSLLPPVAGGYGWGGDCCQARKPWTSNWCQTPVERKQVWPPIRRVTMSEWDFYHGFGFSMNPTWFWQQLVFPADHWDS